MIQHGLKPIKKDKRDYSFNKTFGALLSPLPTFYNVDIGLTNPNQNAEGAPFGCTGYTQAELCSDEDGVVYRPWYTYQKTCLMEGHDTTSGCELRNSLKSTIVYGVQPIDGTTDEAAFPHRRGQYYRVEPVGDYFDGIRTAMWMNRNEKRAVSLGIPWFPEFSNPQDGIIPDVFIGSPSDQSWHNLKICGWKTIDGQPYLIGKPWIGPNWGDRGFCYFSRTTINALLSIRGTGAFTLGVAKPEDIQTIKINIFEIIINFLKRILWIKS